MSYCKTNAAKNTNKAKKIQDNQGYIFMNIKLRLYSVLSILKLFQFRSRRTLLTNLPSSKKYAQQLFKKYWITKNKSNYIIINNNWVIRKIAHGQRFHAMKETYLLIFLYFSRNFPTLPLIFGRLSIWINIYYAKMVCSHFFLRFHLLKSCQDDLKFDLHLENLLIS